MDGASILTMNFFSLENLFIDCTSFAWFQEMPIILLKKWLIGNFI